MTPATAPRPHSDRDVVARPKPLTDPADLMTLLGRFMACGVLFILTIAAFVMRQFVVGICLGIFSLFWQRATTGMWRRLRDERMTAQAARDAEAAESADASEGAASAKATAS